MKLESISDFTTAKNYAWRAYVDSDHGANGKKSDYFCVLSTALTDESCDVCNLVVISGFPNSVVVVNFDLSDDVYKPLIKVYKAKTGTECITLTMVSSYWGGTVAQVRTYILCSFYATRLGT